MKRWAIILAALVGVGIAVSARQFGRQHPAPVQASSADQLLQQVAELPVFIWSYRWRRSVRHIGPMAQSFARLGFGSNPRTINLLDAFGVALTAVQALYAQVQDVQARLQPLGEGACHAVSAPGQAETA